MIKKTAPTQSELEYAVRKLACAVMELTEIVQELDPGRTRQISMIDASIYEALESLTKMSG